ncbi:NADH-quinone oxidoreductase subunit I [Propioniciclava soli]|uniref:4Fe-4S binding protein n=1 Tax=Propioniciclava soli TaxID=2775081 RepID=A0ABZ3C9I6_9ACTN|nr:4Fe-4S binding protein [Propioniciclava soli]
MTHARIRLVTDRCTSCMICARECPTWCIGISSHTEPLPDSPPGPRQRTHHVLDSFTLDWSLCMYCGICIEECPFDALEWDTEVPRATASAAAMTEELT